MGREKGGREWGRRRVITWRVSKLTDRQHSENWPQTVKMNMGTGSRLGTQYVLSKC